MAIIGVGSGRGSGDVGSSLPVVYGYRDVGAMMGGLTRWKPRRVICTTDSEHRDQPGREYVVKYAQGQDGTAALISETVCHGLLEAGGLSTLEAAIVEVSERLSASYRATGLPFPVEPGQHFGTVWRDDVTPAPPAHYEDLDDPSEIIDVWVFDSWLMNIDREVHGNLLMCHRESRSGWTLIPADQSDCFGGATVLQSGAYRVSAASWGRATSHSGMLQRAILDNGPSAITAAIDKARSSFIQIENVLRRVPANWWVRAGVSSEEVRECLSGRLKGLETIMGVREWEGLADATRGGRILDI